jgi:hypothetical protein
MSLKKIIISIATIFVLGTAVAPTQMDAQCPMCRMSAESNLQNGGTEGQGLNKGILFMLAMPYLLVGVIGYAWYRQKLKGKEASE